MSKKIYCAGHICLDITPSFPEQKSDRIEEVLKPGKLLNVDKVNVTVGGPVNNTGLAMKVLGNDVALAGKIGDDAFGDMLANILRGYDAADGLIRKSGESTSYSVVVAVPGIDRIFLHHTGANDTFCADDLDDKALSEAALFHFGYPPLMRRIYEHDGEELVAVLKKAKEAGCATSLDMAMVDPSSEAGQADWKKILEKALPYVDFFVPSVEETFAMLDPEKSQALNEKAGGRDLCDILSVEEDIAPLAEKVMSLGAKILLLKCGAPGIYFRSAEKEVLSALPERLGLNIDKWAGKAWFEKSFKPDAIVDGTGAGDTSIAAFHTAMLRGRDPERCVAIATAEGASVIADYGAIAGIKQIDELETRIDEGWEKNQ